MTITNPSPADERLALPDDLEALTAPVFDDRFALPIGESAVPNRDLPEPLRTWWGNHLRRAEGGHGWWGTSPASVTTLREHVEIIGEQDVWAPVRFARKAFAWCVSIPSMAAGYTLLWLMERPIYREQWDGSLPSLSELRGYIRSRGRAGRVYGYTVVLPAHMIAYPLLGVLQRPGGTFLALLSIIGFMITK